MTRRFGTIAALSGVSLATEGGRFVVLLGPSGCDKSTLFRIVAGMDTQYAGRVFPDGRDVTGLPPKERGGAMVFQNYALFPHLSVGEKIVFGLRAARHAQNARRGPRPPPACWGSRGRCTAGPISSRADSSSAAASPAPLSPRRRSA
jgi:ABC-type Fe3+/spermidine/putrescine transport system ATPase subunit